MNITISGFPGSGKTTVAEILQGQLGMRYVSTGQIFREKAKTANMSLSNFGRLAENNPEIDQKIDAAQQKILLEDNVILEGRLAGWIAYRNNLPALKIWLDCDQKTRIKRIVNREGNTIDKKKDETDRREKSERTRYQKIYDIDITNTDIYDLVINTANKKPIDIVRRIIDALNHQNIYYR
jgi:predicted cytidylate kinase